MKDSTTSEISNLFQELIVAKIKEEIELLKEEIDIIKESNESCENKVEKLPKSSLVKQIVEEEQSKVIDLINKVVKDSKSEEYLKEINAFLNKQYAFSDDRTLCLVLDEIQQKNIQVSNEITPIKTFIENNNIENNLISLSDYLKAQCAFDEDESLCLFLEHFSQTTEEELTNIIANQESFVEKYDSIETVLEQYKASILEQIKANAESLRSIQDQLETNRNAIKSNGDSIAAVICKSNNEIEKLNSIIESIDGISKKTDNANTWINNVMDNIGSESEILGLLRSIACSIENVDDSSEAEWTIKSSILDINKRIEELVEKNLQQDELISGFIEKYEHLENSKNTMLKILMTGSIISIVGIISLIVLQIF